MSENMIAIEDINVQNATFEKEECKESRSVICNGLVVNLMYTRGTALADLVHEMN